MQLKEWARHVTSLPWRRIPYAALIIVFSLIPVWLFDFSRKTGCSSIQSYFKVSIKIRGHFLQYGGFQVRKIRNGYRNDYPASQTFHEVPSRHTSGKI